ncbi:hypothetical protein ABT294_07355 [Nonomuraea sp. NPDC000554]|uniref:hypothetical protein n=1 Tax=Nonomuraea sp. NPDC000554 TaxID=3154259 RepID=UPI00332DD501
MIALALLLSWQVVYTEPHHPWLDLDHGTQFMDITATDARHAWAVGENQWGTDGHYSVLVRWNGYGWRRQSLPKKGAYLDLEKVDASRPDNVWVVGTDYEGGADGLLHYDGRRWRFLSLPLVHEAVALGGQRAWAFTDKHAWLYDGAKRQRFDVPIEAHAADALAENDIWAVGYTGGDHTQPAAAHWDGRAWTAVPVPPAPGEDVNDLTTVLAVSPTEVWAAGSTDNGPLLYRWDGTRWAAAVLRTEPITSLIRHHDRIWAADGKHLLRQTNQTGGRWLRNTPQRPITALASGGGRVWALSGKRILSIR